MHTRTIPRNEKTCESDFQQLNYLETNLACIQAYMCQSRFSPSPLLLYLRVTDCSVGSEIGGLPLVLSDTNQGEIDIDVPCFNQSIHPPHAHALSLQPDCLLHRGFAWLRVHALYVLRTWAPFEKLCVPVLFLYLNSNISSNGQLHRFWRADVSFPLCIDSANFRVTLPSTNYLFSTPYSVIHSTSLIAAIWRVAKIPA
jgi:hypothetical protein